MRSPGKGCWSVARIARSRSGPGGSGIGPEADRRLARPGELQPAAGRVQVAGPLAGPLGWPRYHCPSLDSRPSSVRRGRPLLRPGIVTWITLPSPDCSQTIRSSGSSRPSSAYSARKARFQARDGRPAGAGSMAPRIRVPEPARSPGLEPTSATGRYSVSGPLAAR